MSNYQDYVDLKEKVDKKQREADRAQGALEQAKKQLEEKFNCSAIEEAEELLKEMKAKEAKAKKSFEKNLEKFEEKWGDDV